MSLPRGPKSNGSSAVAVAADLNGSSAVAGSLRGPSPTLPPINDADQSAPEHFQIPNHNPYTLSASRRPPYTGEGVFQLQEPTRDTRHADVAPSAVENAVNAAGGASAVAAPTNIEAGPPSTADAGNAAGASSAVAASAPAAPVLKDANSAAIVAPVIAGKALTTRAKRKAVVEPGANLSYLKADIETAVQDFFWNESWRGIMGGRTETTGTL